MITDAGQRVPRHGLWLAVIWLVLTAIAVPLIVFVLGPHPDATFNRELRRALHLRVAFSSRQVVVLRRR